MIRYVIETMLGPWGRAALNFYFEHQTILNLIFLAWAFVMTYGSLQLREVRTKTIRMAVDLLRMMKGKSDQEVWNAFEPRWREMVSEKKRMVPNRWNLWITSATPEHLIALLRMSPEWLGALRGGEVLRNHLEMPGAKNTPVSDIIQE